MSNQLRLRSRSFECKERKAVVLERCLFSRVGALQGFPRNNPPVTKRKQWDHQTHSGTVGYYAILPHIQTDAHGLAITLTKSSRAHDANQPRVVLYVYVQLIYVHHCVRVPTLKH